MKKNKAYRVIVSILLCFLFLVFTLFLIESSNHTCEDPHCSICSIVRRQGSGRDYLPVDRLVVKIDRFYPIAFISLLFSVSYFLKMTLISLKVKLTS